MVLTNTSLAQAQKAKQETKNICLKDIAEPVSPQDIKKFLLEGKPVHFCEQVCTAKLGKLPEGIQFPERLKNEVRYLSEEQLLIFKGSMNEGKRKELLNLSEDQTYQEAIEKLSQQDKEKRLIKAEWITEALRQKPSVKQINIYNAIIVGGLDLSIGVNPVSLEKSDLEPEVIEALGRLLIGYKVYVVPTIFSITNCVLEGTFTTGSSYLTEATVFQNDINFALSTFKSKASFVCTRFHGGASFNKTVFEVEADFRLTYFQRTASFYEAKFLKKENLSREREGSVDFFGSNFKGDTDFRSAIFGIDTGFGRANFQSVASYRGATFLGKVNFQGATFKEEVVFSGATFAKEVNLIDASYPRLRVSWSQLMERYSLNGIFGPEPKGKLDGTLQNLLATLQGVKLKESKKKEWKTLEEFLEKVEFSVKLQKLPRRFQFPDSLRDRIRYDKKKQLLILTGQMKPKEKSELLNLAWEIIKDEQESPEAQGLAGSYMGAIEELPHKPYLLFEQGGLLERNFISWQCVYIRLIKNFEDLGDTKSAYDTYYYYRKMMPKFRRVSIDGEEYIVGRGLWEKTLEWLEYIFFGLTCGYGVRPLYALIAEGILIIVATFVFFLRKGSLEYQQEEGRCLRQCLKRFGNCFYFSVMLATTVGRVW